MNVAVEHSESREGVPLTYGGILRVSWNAKKTKLDAKLELVDNPGLNRTKVNNFKIAVRFFDLSHPIDFGEVNGKLMQEYVVECYVILQATNVVTTEIQVLNRWPSRLGDNYVDSGHQYPVEAIMRAVPAPRVKSRQPAGSKTKRPGRSK